METLMVSAAVPIMAAVAGVPVAVKGLTAGEKFLKPMLRVSGLSIAMKRVLISVANGIVVWAVANLEDVSDMAVPENVGLVLAVPADLLPVTADAVREDASVDEPAVAKAIADAMTVAVHKAEASSAATEGQKERA